HQKHAGLPGRARIALGGVARPLLVAHEDVLDLFLLEQLVIDRKDRAARIAEEMRDAIVLQRLHHHFRACHFALLVLSVAHRHVPFSSMVCLVRRNKKGPRGSLSSAHGVLSPGGYTALPMRFPTTRMSFIVMGRTLSAEIAGSQSC